MEGVRGTVWYGTEREDEIDWKGEHCGLTTVRLGLTYPAILRDGVLFIWRDGQWIESPGYAKWFRPDE